MVSEIQLKEEHLRFVSDHNPGFSREKVGKEFKYYDLKGKTIKDPHILDRIKNLGIPPAWKDVWVCSLSNGHLQATGLDEKGRKQYIYHPDWIALSQENKFNKMIDFGFSLPKIRSRVSYDLGKKEIDKRKILATVVWLLEHTFIRIGNEEYYKDNNSIGLTTLRNKHVKIRGSSILFEFKGKSGVQSKIAVINSKIAKTIKACIELPGYKLFQFVDDRNQRHVVDSSDINLFLKDVTKDDFSAKDFRTWGGTNISATSLFKIGPAENIKALRQNIKETVKKVASHLNNTVSVCRNYYIHPKVIQSYQENVLIPHYSRYSNSKPGVKGLSWTEYALIKLLQK
ncbi:hypothetical protein A3C59_04120 [Candidatus Daviesbacteria bacterium RIFCSPHIGHO2_02_FULL_36_13]|uniref:DNA topoisomerase n=1 Tax=Candidatus Daviesbacteria bacterium RIFCSPHIGHO2_02_FULL_36_13 TaxID=1797768 RepID=A0A1F5JR79_9BACT|nr:MAG: hypothetical protein A3C59_04120 [Candidatus Daviesbacteria bacterium RIFCSPHIGHO2_02_FULL_36_13]OGE44137.1 MAG: hypothetical protein A3A45_00590 [Candidatus Daviesbacteria bacterium RIFCSPLOWO2_01_FULL_36_8]